MRKLRRKKLKICVIFRTPQRAADVVAYCLVGALGHSVQLQGVGRARLMMNARQGKIESELIGEVLSTIVAAQSTNHVIAVFLKQCTKEFEAAENIILIFHREDRGEFGTIIYQCDIILILFP
jgi:hypothetical protein